MGMRIAAALAFTVLATAAVIAYASRNSSGTMAAANGPYVAGTVISSSVINARFGDIEAEITDSLSRSGKGGMTAPLRTADGTVASPAHSFTGEVGSGLYRIGASDLGMSVAGVKTQEWTSTGTTVTGALGATGTITSAVAGTASTSLATLFEPSLAVGNNTNIIIGSANVANGAGFLTYTSNATPALSTLCLDIAGNGSTLCVNGNAKTTTAGAFAVTGASTLTGALAANGGATIGSSGTAISSSIRGTTSWTPGTITSVTSVTTTITVTGAVAGADCVAVAPGQLDTRINLQCWVTTNTCNLQESNPSTTSAAGPSGTYACRVFNP